jgi:NTP pyrophosphatase (non-canonical NTP hydrolase)
MEKSLDDLRRRVVRFRDERNWRRFHNPKDLAISISLEAAELLEKFQWRDADEVLEVAADAESREEIGDEMADIMILLLSASDALGIDLHDATVRKLGKNARKYPVEKAKGNARKYDRLD